VILCKTQQKFSNGSEFRAFIRVDNSGQQIWGEIKPAAKEMPILDIGNYTEVEVTLPLINSLSDEHLIDKLVRHFNISRIDNFNIEFGLK
jgi:hypothetical protein